MDIILKGRTGSDRVDCILRRGEAVSAGTAAEGDSLYVGNAILVGTGDTDAEEYEERLRAGLKGALDVARAKEYKRLSVDADSFVSDPVQVGYAENLLLDGLTECGRSTSGCDLEISLVSSANRGDERLLQEVEAALRTPVIKIQNQSFGDYGDPLKTEFEQEFLNDQEVSFKIYFLKLIEERGFHKYSDVYKRAGVSKSTFSKIMNFSLDYKPSKSTVAAFAIGLGLDIREAQKFYHSAGYHLGMTDLADRIVRFFIEKNIYDIVEVNCCMVYYGLPPLGEHPRDDRVRILKK